MEKPYPPVQYADYLYLDRLLSCQNMISEKYGKSAHDEMMFIITHQVYELWFKQILFELDSIISIFKDKCVHVKDLGKVVTRFHRIIEIQKILIDQLKVIETMTPIDYLDFREFLLPASGLQSVQYRLIEIKFGVLPKQRPSIDQYAYKTHFSKEHLELLEYAENEDSLHDVIVRWLENTPFLEFGTFHFWQTYRDAVLSMIDNDRAAIRNNSSLTEKQREVHLGELDRTEEKFLALFDQNKYQHLVSVGARRLPYKAIQAALLIMLYRDQPILQMPFRLIDALIDVDEIFTAWRYEHSLMAHRMIGKKIGTGGSSGYHYLMTTAESHRVFTDLIDLSTYLIPRSALPTLPPDIVQQLGFHFQEE